MRSASLLSGVPLVEVDLATYFSQAKPAHTPESLNARKRAQRAKQNLARVKVLKLRLFKVLKFAPTELCVKALKSSTRRKPWTK